MSLSNAPQPFPLLDDATRGHSARVAFYLREQVKQAGGWLAFEQWMAAALYTPGLGYYAAGHIKLASAPISATAALQAANSRIPPPDGPNSMPARVPVAGDFVTAPELTPLFGRTLARQVAEVLADSESDCVLEFGAGTGALAESILDALTALGIDASYRILEVSADLRARQTTRLARFGNRVQWLDALPDAFCGCVLANEVLDAMPVTVFRFDESNALWERGVAIDSQDQFIWADRPAGAALSEALKDRLPPMAGYTSEINLQAEAWMRGLGGWLKRGAALLIDYGFPQAEYYHPQRASGTLMCHLRHHAHDDPFLAPGAQDITAHVDFTAMAQAAIDSGLDLLGYVPQNRFLMNAGIEQCMADLDAADARHYAESIGPVQKLLSEAEMGELFKVLAVGRGLSRPLSGFATRDRRASL
jgi:SAM-dependent MidA family methyltransferase